MRVVLVAATEILNDIPGYNQHHWSLGVLDADDLAEEAGRLCYESWQRPNPKTATNSGYLANIISQQHFSVLEHASATFYIDGVSRNFSHELIRHRHLSFSEVSQRYVDPSEFPFIQPPAVMDQMIVEQNVPLGDPGAGDLSNRIVRAYRMMVEALAAKGLDRKQARQAARAILPGGLETKVLVSGNLRAWREVLQKRLSPAADREFQLVAKEILVKLKEIAPNTYQDLLVPE